MPIFTISLTKGLTPDKQKQLYEEVAKTIATIQECPIDAISGHIQTMELYQIGQGGKTWEDKID